MGDPNSQKIMNTRVSSGGGESGEGRRERREEWTHLLVQERGKMAQHNGHIRMIGSVSGFESLDAPSEQ